MEMNYKNVPSGLNCNELQCSFNPLKNKILLNNIYKFQFVPHRKRITSPLQRPTGAAYGNNFYLL